MTLEKGLTIHGFTVNDIVPLADCSGTLYKMTHDKTGAQLCWLKRDDKNKTFTITFKTLPFDDTGVFHILEHSVLCGSDKYPVREPFVELLKSSMQTFLNAFTFPDKTMYPVASRNEKDFMNLMSVYMDAVFHPAIYTNPNIFYQEGWHHEIRSAEDTPIYKGVVLNEMKGAFASVDETIINEFNRLLFPDNCYRYCSGGDPVHIPDLTYEQFIETHKKFYHPSNARVFLDGDLNIDQTLAFINDEYFSKYEKEEMDFTIPMQEIRRGSHSRYLYETAPGTGTEDLTQIAFAKIICDFTEIEKNLAWTLLCNMLVENNESPLKKCILDRHLGEDVELDLVEGIQQPWVVLNIRNTNEKNFEEIRRVLRETVEQMVKEGLDHENIIACLNQMEFRYRETHEPAGIMYAQSSMNSWLYGGEPELYLQIGDLFEELRRKTEEGYFEKLLAEFMLEEETLHTLIAVPSETLGEERTAAENARLASEKESWGADIEKYININKALDDWQNTPDTEEQLHTLPRLSLSDVETKPENFTCEETKIMGVPVMLHPEDSRGIVYLTAFFSLGGVTKDYLPSLGFYTSLLGQLRTKNTALPELRKKIRMYTGGFGFYIDCFTPVGNHESCIPVIAVSCSALQQNIDKVIPLIIEVMKETEFTPETILPLLKQSTEGNRQRVISSGHSIAHKRAAAHYTSEAAFREYVSGYTNYLYEKELSEHFDEKIPEFINECEMYSDILFSRARMTGSITGERNLPVMEQLIDGMGTEDGMRSTVRFPLLKDTREVIVIPAAVAFTTSVSDLYSQGYKFQPGMQVLAHILSYVYLWSEVRVKGGAYGTAFFTGPSGITGGYSYRDPDPENAFRAFREAGTYMKENADNIDLEQMIIGMVASANPLLSPSAKIRMAETRWFRHVTYESLCKAREQQLAMTADDIRTFAEIFETSMQNTSQAVVTSREAADEFVKNGYIELKQL